MKYFVYADTYGASVWFDNEWADNDGAAIVDDIIDTIESKYYGHIDRWYEAMRDGLEEGLHHSQRFFVKPSID